MQLEISAEERDLLARILERDLSETRIEARRTSTRTYHDQLQHEEAMLRTLLERLRGLG